MSDRFFSETPIAGADAIIDGPEAHHLLHVMRGRVGDRITVFDGSSAEFDAEVTRCDRSQVKLRILRRREVNRELPFDLVVGVSLPKGERQKWLIEKLTELGATALVPLETERGVAQPTASALDRLRRSVIEATKQCGRNCLMQIASPQAWNQYAKATDPKSRRLVAHFGGVPVVGLNFATRMATYLAIGPEGGFTPSEINAATSAGWQIVDLGPRILRVETAATALTAVVAASSHP
jgi:16S rRNA (uracil1498-N3)-methyltransferase